MRVYTQTYISKQGNGVSSIEAREGYLESNMTIIYLDKIKKYLVVDGSEIAGLYDITGEKLKEVELYHAEDARPKEISGPDEGKQEGKDN